jgi:branched-chain amino acid aminotransferase
MDLLPLHKYFILNGELNGVKQFISGENEGGIYEVLRVVSGNPLFLEDHLERLFHSAKLAGKNIGYSESQISDFLMNLIEKNKATVGNILISCKINLEAFFVAHVYPTDKMYKEGVNCGILKAERDNPNAKVLQTSLRKKADIIISEKGFFEVILVDHLGKITEGSRSNIFFVSENKIVTSPANRVLVGITRQKTIQMAAELNITVDEREVNFSELHSFDAAFITGTSPKILPILKIDAFKFNPQNQIVGQLMKKYDELIDEYVKKIDCTRVIPTSK